MVSILLGDTVRSVHKCQTKLFVFFTMLSQDCEEMCKDYER